MGNHNKSLLILIFKKFFIIIFKYYSNKIDDGPRQQVEQIFKLFNEMLKNGCF
jgi:hypothetical protein